VGGVVGVGGGGEACWGGRGVGRLGVENRDIVGQTWYR